MTTKIIADPSVIAQPLRNTHKNDSPELRSLALVAWLMCDFLERDSTKKMRDQKAPKLEYVNHLIKRYHEAMAPFIRKAH